jgi:S1-C subfamily serine protease
MTNAHVVAGVEHPVVEVAGAQYRAVVVYYDPDVDIAVLSVPGLPAPALSFGPAVASRAPAAVLGFPENGPYDAEPARVRDLQTLRSPNIYGTTQVERQTYSLYAVVRPGNSGGPLIDRRGQVLGVVFAASVTDGTTGYAVTAAQVAVAAHQGDSSAKRVNTGACAR